MDLNRGGGATYRAFKENCVGEEVYDRGDSVVPSTTKAGLYIADLEAPRSFGRPEAPGLAGEPPKLTRADSRRGSKDSKVSPPSPPLPLSCHPFGRMLRLSHRLPYAGLHALLQCALHTKGSPARHIREFGRLDAAGPC